jgi:multiple sugar transport system ATP-binding protein
MAQLAFEGVTKVFADGTEAVRDLDLDVGDGELMVLVGPSGSGKSTALRMLAGLEDATAGTIRIGARVVNDVAPKDRDIAMVFQSYALYPHMDVAGNLGFALRMQRMQRPSIAERVSAAAQRLGLADLVDKRPRNLSGGQRQRVAVGRAIVREPQAFSWTSRCRTSTRSCAWRCGAYLSRCATSWDTTRSTSLTTRSRR